jgi:hypothetical protein
MLHTFLKQKQHLYSVNSAIYEERINALVRLFALTCLPTTLLDNAAFREFIVGMDPQFKPPG